MAFDFPANPTIGQIVIGPGGVEWTWDGVKWVSTGTSGSGASITVSDTAPSNPGPGALWFDSVGLQLYVFYNDGDSEQWVPVNNQALAGFLALTGGTLTGPLILAADPTTALGAATKEYADSTATGFSSHNVGRNLFHNGLFNVQQRGTGAFTAAGAGTADRWFMFNSLDTNSVTLPLLADADRTAIGDEAAVSALNYVFTGSASANSYTFFTQRIESTRRTSGKTVTVSFWARPSAAGLKVGVGYYQTFGTGGSPSPSVTGNFGVVTLATAGAWQRYTVIGTVPSASGKTFGTTVGTDALGFEFWLSDQANLGRSGGIGVQAGTVAFWGMQFEFGSVVTPLEKLDPRLDLANCQRFYQATPGASPVVDGGWAGTSGSAALSSHSFAVVMRATPTMTLPTSGFAGVATAITVYSASQYGFNCTISTNATGVYFANYGYTASADL